MRILHILDHSLPLHSGYAVRTIAILREQRALGWDTVHLTTPKQTTPYVASEIFDGWEFHRTPAPNSLIGRLPILREWALMRATRQRLREVAEEVKPDILHAHSPVLNALPTLAVGKDMNLPVVYEIRAFWEDAAVDQGTAREDGPRYRATRMMETRAARRAHAVTTICQGLRDDLVARGIDPQKITIIPNAVDTDRFAASRPPKAEQVSRFGLAGKTVIGFLGSFYAYEGLDLLLEALPAVLAARPEARILFVGGGPGEENLKIRSVSAGLADKVVFVGRVSHDEIQDYYDLVDILVYPRYSMRLTETVTPLKPLEVMAQEKPMVASDVGGHRELIRDGETGFLFPAGDAEALAARLIEVLERPEIWPTIGRNGRRFVVQERNWRASVANYRQVYERVLGRPI